MGANKTGKQCRVVHTLRFCSAKLLVGGRPPIPRNSSVPELAARFYETLYNGPLAQKVAQADGTVKVQNSRRRARRPYGRLRLASFLFAYSYAFKMALWRQMDKEYCSPCDHARKALKFRAFSGSKCVD